MQLLDDMKRWFEATLATLYAKSDATKAIRYSMNRWPALVYYCSDGRVEIDNLIAERALRGVAIGRCNYLFVGADSGGKRAAAMYSLIGTARLNGLERIADHPINRIDELLPWSVAPSLQSTAHVGPIRSHRGYPPSTTCATVLTGRLPITWTDHTLDPSAYKNLSAQENVNSHNFLSRKYWFYYKPMRVLALSADLRELAIKPSPLPEFR